MCYEVDDDVVAIIVIGDVVVVVVICVDCYIIYEYSSRMFNKNN